MKHTDYYFYRYSFHFNRSVLQPSLNLKKKSILMGFHKCYIQFWEKEKEGFENQIDMFG